eukprot:gene46051-57412_t
MNVSATLTDLSLSHNQLTGTIPLQIQSHPWSSLDLSFNKLTGVLSDGMQPARAIAVAVLFACNLGCYAWTASAAFLSGEVA